MKSNANHSNTRGTTEVEMTTSAISMNRNTTSVADTTDSEQLISDLISQNAQLSLEVNDLKTELALVSLFILELYIH